ncbi:MAG: DMT family transporter, partial [Bacillota bacterium]
LSILAGIMVSLQGIFNTRASEHIGLWQTNTLVHGTGFILAFIILISLNQVNFSTFKNVEPHYLLGGVFGVIIVFSVMIGISSLGASYSITILIVTQIIANALINYFGIFGEHVIVFSWPKILGISMMIVGIMLYQLS